MSIYDKYRDTAHSICNLKFNVPNGVLVVFHNKSSYSYHLVTKELAKEFDEKFECLGENTEKCKTFFNSNKKFKKLIKMSMKIM